MIHKIGNRLYETEDLPMDKFSLHDHCLVIWGGHVLIFERNWKSGYEGSPDKITYCTCKLYELNKTKWYHTSVRECYRIIKTNSRRLIERFGIEGL